MNTKEFRATVKSAKIDLQKEVSSVSFWINTIAKSAQTGDCRRAVVHVLNIEKLPAKEELKRELLNRALSGFKFFSEDGNILVIRKEFERDANGNIVRMDDKPVVKSTWYERKGTFTFLSVWQAIFSPAKTKVIVPDAEIK